MFSKLRFKFIVSTLAISIIFVSCLSDDDLEDSLEVYTDAYVIKKKIGNQPGYAPIFFAYANQLLRAVSVTEMGGSGQRFNLTQDPTSITTMSRRPQASDFKAYPPAASDYQFQITAESGVNVEKHDFLDYDDIPIPEITKAEFSENNKMLEILWSDVSNADGFLVKIVDSEGYEISTSNGLDSGTNSYTINIVLEDWYTAPESGQSYSIQVHAFAYEAEYDTGYEVYNIQEVSIAEESLEWP